MRTMIRLVASLLLLVGLAAFAPPSSNSIGVVPTSLCAQTGSCRYYYYDICVVNGRIFYNRYWKGANDLQ